MRYLIPACLAFALVLVTALPASAAMVTTSEYGPVEQGVPGPTFCLDEDDAHLRNFSGTLQPGESFTVSERLCTIAESYNGAGSAGIGIEYKAEYSKGQSVNLHIVFPDGTVRQAHRTAGYNEWAGCVNPKMRPAPAYRPGGLVMAPAAGGTYQIVLTNTGTKPINSRNPLTELVWSNTMFIPDQQNECPGEDQNIVWVLVDSLSPTTGSVGTPVTLTGYGFTGVTSVTFSGTPTPATFTIDSDTQISTVVPVGAGSGPISVTVPDGVIPSQYAFTVT